MILFRKGESYNDNGWASEKEGVILFDQNVLKNYSSSSLSIACSS
jgi:hypothetical protein